MNVDTQEPNQGANDRSIAPIDSDTAEEETRDHYKTRMNEVEPELGRRGRWGYLFWVALWVAVLALVVIIYAIAGRAI